MQRAILGLLVALVMGDASSAWGQSISGDLVVRVTDPNGANIVGAKVALIEVATSIRQEAATDGLGLVLFQNLKPGQYQAEIAQAGFQTQTVKDMRIQVGQRARVDVEMKLGQVTESITVSAASETLLNRESAAIGQVLDQTAIVNLPLSGRNFMQLAAITAGAVPIGIGTSPATSWTGRSDMTLSIAGGRESNNR
ncbi:MAG: carboxypeptidase-like regulatory domain-containing protein, partial [Acidobacteriota bacterium]